MAGRIVDSVRWKRKTGSASSSRSWSERQGSGQGKSSCSPAVTGIGCCRRAYHCSTGAGFAPGSPRRAEGTRCDAGLNSGPGSGGCRCCRWRACSRWRSRRRGGGRSGGKRRQARRSQGRGRQGPGRQARGCAGVGSRSASRRGGWCLLGRGHQRSPKRERGDAASNGYATGLAARQSSPADLALPQAPGADSDDHKCKEDKQNAHRFHGRTVARPETTHPKPIEAPGQLDPVRRHPVWP